MTGKVQGLGELAGMGIGIGASVGGVVVLGLGHHGRIGTMATILPFRKPVKEKGLCQHGFHKWKIRQDKQFDVQQGRLVTLYRCERCGEQKVKAH